MGVDLRVKGWSSVGGRFSPGEKTKLRLGLLTDWVANRQAEGGVPCHYLVSGFSSRVISSDTHQGEGIHEEGAI